MTLARGMVADRPWGLTFGAFGTRRMTGQLTLTSDGKSYCVAFEHGAVVGASSPFPGDSVARVALINHFATSTQIGAIARRVAAEPGRDEVDILAEMNTLSPDQTLRLRRRVIAQRAARTFSIDSGVFVFDGRTTIATRRDGALDVRAVVYLGARMNLTEQRLADDLRPFGGQFVLRPGALADLEQYGFTAAEQPVLDALRLGSSLPELEARHREVDPRTLHAIIYALLSCSGCDATAPLPPPEPSLASPPVVRRARTDSEASDDGFSITMKPSPRPTRTSPGELYSHTGTGQRDITLPRTATGAPAGARTTTVPGEPRTMTTPGGPRTMTAPGAPRTTTVPGGPRTMTAPGAPPTLPGARTTTAPNPTQAARTATSSAPPMSGARTTTPPVSGTRTTTPPMSGARTTTPPMSGARTTTPPVSGARTTTPTVSDARTTAPPLSGVRTTAPPLSGVRTTAPPPADARTTTPPLSGPGTAAPPLSGVRPTTPPLSGPGPAEPPLSGGRMTASPMSGAARSTAPSASDARTTTLPGPGATRASTSPPAGARTTTSPSPTTYSSSTASRATSSPRASDSSRMAPRTNTPPSVPFEAPLATPPQATTPPPAGRATSPSLGRATSPSLGRAATAPSTGDSGTRWTAIGTPSPPDAPRDPSTVTATQLGGPAGLTPGDPSALAEEAYTRGSSALRREDLPEALAELTRATELLPNDVDYQAVLAWARFISAGDKPTIADETRKTMARAINKSKRPELAHFYLGRVERMLGRDREALRHFHEVLDVQPRHADAAAEVRMIEARLAAAARRR